MHTFRIIVSAPNGTAPGANSVANTGLLYQCPIAQGDCEPLNGDDSGADRRLYDTDGQYIYAIKWIYNILYFTTIEHIYH